MPPLATEAEWLGSVDPSNSYWTLGLVREPNALDPRRLPHVPQRFRFLAVSWGQRIAHLIPAESRQWFLGFVAWTLDGGPEPEWAPEDEFTPDGQVRVDAGWWASEFIEALRFRNFDRATPWAAHFAFLDPAQINVSVPEPYRGRVKRLKAASEEARRLALAEQGRQSDERESALRLEFCEQFRCVAGNPFRPAYLRPEWRSEHVVAIAEAVERTGDYAVMPILADALEDAGCDCDALLEHCRGPGPHVRGCWAIDLIRRPSEFEV